MPIKKRKMRVSLTLDGDGFADVVDDQGLDIGHSDFLITFPPNWWAEAIKETKRREKEK